MLDVQRILLWMVAASCFMQAVQGWRARSNGVVVAAVVTAALAGCAWLLAPAVAGWAALGLWVALCAVPSLLIGRVVRHPDGGGAWVGARLITMPPFLHTPRIASALRHARRDDVDGAVAALASIQADPRLAPGTRALARGHFARLTGAWDAFLAADRPQPDEPQALAAMRVRAFGETGQLREMLGALAGQRRGSISAPLSLLFALAFSGRRQGVATLLAGPLRGMSGDWKSFWSATASLAAGDGTGLRAVNALATSSRNGQVRQAARLRLANPVTQAAWAIGPAGNRALDLIEGELVAPAARTSGKRPYATLGIIALTVIAYFVEVAHGGAENTATLYAMGGLSPDAVLLQGQWWRLVTPLFLHYGPLHIGFNMVALLVIGARVEQMLGAWRLALVYFASGILSCAAVLALMQAGVIAPDMLVGASGAIFGLVGALALVYARGWWSGRSRLALRGLQDVLLVVALQAAFDLSTPDVSFSGHASGLLFGILVAALVLPRREESIRR